MLSELFTPFLFHANKSGVHNKGKVKGKGHLITGHEDPEGEEMYSSTIFLTSALDVVGCQRHDPAAFPPGKTRYPLYRRLGGPQGRYGRVQKISPSPGFDHRTVQPVFMLAGEISVKDGVCGFCTSSGFGQRAFGVCRELSTG